MATKGRVTTSRQASDVIGGPSISALLAHADQFDLEAAVKTCLAHHTIALPKINDLERLDTLACVIADSLRARKLTFWHFCLSVLKEDGGLTDRAQTSQQRGGLRTLPSSKVIRGSFVSPLENAVARQFLNEAYRPDVQGDDRLSLRLILYSTDLFVDSVLSPNENDNKRTWYHLRKAVGGACLQEILDRLAQHPTSRDVYELVHRNDAGALTALLRRVNAKTRDLPPYEDDSEKQSVAVGHLWERIHHKLSVINSQAIREGTRNRLILGLAMDGHFDVVPHEIRMKFIDDARAASAQRRGGDGKHLPVFDPLTLDGDLESDRTVDVEDAPHQQPTSNAAAVHETNDLWMRVTFDLRREKLRSNDKLLKELGPAATLLRYFLEHPDDDDLTDAELASRLGVKTVRTIYNYRKRLRLLRETLIT